MVSFKEGIAKKEVVMFTKINYLILALLSLSSLSSVALADPSLSKVHADCFVSDGSDTIGSAAWDEGSSSSSLFIPVGGVFVSSKPASNYRYAVTVNFNNQGGTDGDAFWMDLFQYDGALRTNPFNACGGVAQDFGCTPNKISIKLAHVSGAFVVSHTVLSTGVISEITSGPLYCRFSRK
jgi:hypothetical protein